MNYTTGQRFKAKIQGVPVEGKIYVASQDSIFLCQNTHNGYESPDNLGYQFSWQIGDGSAKQLKYYGITDLQILPDTFDKDNCKETTEPKKGDYEGSDDGNKWYKITDEYTGIEYKGLHLFFVKSLNIFVAYKHIRLAKSPEQTKREEAEKKATNWMEENKHLLKHKEWRSQVEALTEYIKTEGK